MADEVNIIRFKAQGDQRGKIHTGIQPKDTMAARPLCRDLSLKIGEVILNCQDQEECTVCRMKRFDLKIRYGSLKDWADREGYVVRSEMVEK